MCGIAGIFNLEKEVKPEVLKTFTDSLEHRGPDGAGYDILAGGLLGLGHRRLSILDLSERGRQPMTYADGRFTIAYNGEIYNFLELRAQLEQKGHRFQSDTDTEVIMAAYLEWGTACFDRFNGMWAFALWDEQERQLMLSRDRFGIKPLYYLCIPGKMLALASETRAFRFLDGYQRSVDDELSRIALDDDYALEGLGYTIFSNIRQVLPGHYAVFSARHRELEQKRWWSIEPVLSTAGVPSMEAAAEQFRELLLGACRYRLISDVPLATALSGGLDSSSVFATVQKVLAENPHRVNENSQKAVSAVFPGLENDEREYVELMLRHTGKQAIWVETDFTDLTGQIEHDTRMLDALSSAPITSVASIYKGMKKAGITVSLDGHGVDEMMYGYRDMVATLYQHYLWSGGMKQAREAGEALVGMYHPADVRAGLAKVERQLEEKKKREASIKYRLKKRLKKSTEPFTHHSLPVRLTAIGESYDFSQQPLEKRMLLYETFQHTLPALFRNFDRASMMNGVEIRMPFMDYRIVEFLFSLPPEFKFGRGMTKLLLREAMRDELPQEIVKRKFKVGISSPAVHWFNGPLNGWFMDHLHGTELKGILEKEKNINGIYSGNTITRAWKEINLKLIGS